MEDRQDLIEYPPFELSDADREVLNQRDEDFIPHTWEELRQVIATKDTSSLRRTPTGLANYIRWIRQTLQSYDAVATYIVVRTLQWTLPSASLQPASTFISATDLLPVNPRSPTIFTHPSDYSICRNDWPYGCEHGITHLVVWLKNRIPVDDKSGDPLPDAEARIEAFVQSTFRARVEKFDLQSIQEPDTQQRENVGRVEKPEQNGVLDAKIENWTVDGLKGRDATVDFRGHQEPAEDVRMEVMWFRNRTRWQSIRALEHIHVLLRNVPEPIIEEWTKRKASDTICERWARGEQV